VDTELGHYQDLAAVAPDLEQLTVLVVAGSGRRVVAGALGADLSTSTDPWDTPEGQTAWAILEVPGGVLAVERSGFGDPGLDVLAKVSADGGAAAVVRSNILAHVRFGCAKDGSVLFDDDEYMYIEDPEIVPPELRPLFDLVWDDLTSEPDENRPDGFVVGLALSELVTGVVLKAEEVAAVFETTFHAAPTMRYAADFE
jgi:hypothetical protein